MSNFPEIGSVWRHRNGAEYRVIHLANFYSNNVLYPLTVVYEGVSNGKVWSRPMDQWHRSMTLIEGAPPAAAHGDEAVLWELLEGLRTATDRQALPGEFIRVMWEAGCAWINARAAMRAQAGEGGV